MHRDAKRLAATGGWDFEGFGGGPAKWVVGNDTASACFACHRPQKDQDYTGKDWRLSDIPGSD